MADFPFVDVADIEEEVVIFGVEDFFELVWGEVGASFGEVDIAFAGD